LLTGPKNLGSPRSCESGRPDKVQTAVEKMQSPIAA
jgi:hypothetical protein